LKQVLANHGVHADTAESAERALDYLRHERPDVVFMDHQMPGMDGFEALEAIKANPATATIPVMMYTSQDGELYVGQARALGAFGVLPKDLKPTEVTQVLRALRLISDPPPADSATPGVTREKADDDTDSQRVRALLQELFYQQHAALREEIREGYEKVAASTAELPVLEPPDRPAGAMRGVLAVATAVLFVLTLVFWGLYSQANRSLEVERQKLAQLGERIARLDAVNAFVDPAPAPAQTPASDDGYRAILRAWEQGIAFSGQYGFGEVALNDTRAQQLIPLMEYLNDAGVSGTVEIAVHVGQFCMNTDAQGGWTLAPPQAPARECERRGWDFVEAEALGAQRSIHFANIQSSVEQFGSIGVQVRSLGDSRPVAAYPAVSDAVTAGEWNEIARRNHYVALRLVP
jgi:CheY-like chemotaxis protein